MSAFQVKNVTVTPGTGLVRPGFGYDGSITLKNSGPDPVLLCNAQPNSQGINGGDVFPLAVGEIVQVADPAEGVVPGLFVHDESAGATVHVIAQH